MASAAIPQPAIAQLGSSTNTSRNALSPSLHQNECSKATERCSRGCTASEQVFANDTAPSFSAGAAFAPDAARNPAVRVKPMRAIVLMTFLLGIGVQPLITNETPCNGSESANEKSDTGHCGDAPSQSHDNRTVVLTCLAHQEAGADSGKVQQRRRDHEAGSIGDAAGILRNFGSMSLTVKNRKQTDDADCHHGRRLDVKRNDCAEHNNRKGYADLDQGNFDAGDTERAASSHDTEKGDRYEPKRSSTE